MQFGEPREKICQETHGLESSDATTFRQRGLKYTASQVSHETALLGVGHLCPSHLPETRHQMSACSKRRSCQKLLSPLQSLVKGIFVVAITLHEKDFGRQRTLHGQPRGPGLVRDDRRYEAPAKRMAVLCSFDINLAPRSIQPLNLQTGLIISRSDPQSRLSPTIAGKIAP